MALPTVIREAVEREIESHRQSIAELETYLQHDKPVRVPKKGMGKAAREEHRRRMVKVWKKRRAEKKAAEIKAHQEAEAALLAPPVVNHVGPPPTKKPKVTVTGTAAIVSSTGTETGSPA